MRRSWTPRPSPPPSRRRAAAAPPLRSRRGARDGHRSFRVASSSSTLSPNPAGTSRFAPRRIGACGRETSPNRSRRRTRTAPWNSRSGNTTSSAGARRTSRAKRETRTAETAWYPRVHPRGGRAHQQTRDSGKGTRRCITSCTSATRAESPAPATNGQVQVRRQDRTTADAGGEE